jgi:hypothetical protein
MRKHGFAGISLVAATSLVFSLGAHAQFDAAAVLGYVRDSAGAAVAHANVTLTNVETGVTVVRETDNEGKYEFPSVKIGDYRISSEAPGFSKSDSTVFAVTVNARQRVDVNLKNGSVNDTVTVSAAPTLLETETSSRGQVIGTREVENLPLNGRSYADLALLAPGVRKSALQNESTSSREASFNVNGQRSAFNNFMLDGLDNNTYGTSNQGFANENIPPSPDAVDEFRVVTNNPSAEYGRASGAIINASIRRGTNSLHGRVWEYNRNTALNAIGPFAPTGGIKPVLIRNQFGGTIGGPILHDRLFFFADYEGLRQIQRNFQSGTLPTAAQKSGNLGVAIRNPLTGTVYANGVVPVADMTPLARLVFAALPDPNATGSANYVNLPRGTTQDDKGDVRVDWNMSSKLVLFGRYSQHVGKIFEAPLIGGPAGGNSNGNVNIKNKQIAAGVTYSISPTAILDARFGAGWNQGGKTPIGVGGTSLLTQAGITNGLPTDPTIVRPLNGQNISGYTGFGAQSSNPQFQNPFVINPKVNFTWLRGAHSLKMGYEYQSVSTSVNDFNPTYGSDTYNGQFSKAVSTAANDNRYNIADFMFGLRSNYQLNNFRIIGLQQRFNFMYLQDDWKAASNLTINAGVRYEISTPQYTDGNHLTNFDPSTNSLIQARDGSVYDRALVNVKYNNVAPRLGFAYSADSKTTLRGGYGISFIQFNRQGGENLLAYNGPYVVNASVNQLISQPVCTSDTQDQTTCFRPTQSGYSVNLVAPSAFNPAAVQSRYIPKDNPTGYVQSFFFSVQRQVGSTLVLDLAYVGNKSTHLMSLADYNQARQQTGLCGGTGQPVCLTLQQRRPVSNFGAIQIAYGAGYGNYNAIQFKAEKRLSHGLYLLNSFTYSRGFDNVGGHLETSGGDNSRVNFANPNLDYGPSGYDQPLNNTTSMVWDLPIFRTGNGITHKLLGGWQMTGISTQSSGTPFNLTYNASSNYTTTGLYTFRPNAGGPLFLDNSLRVKTSSSVALLNPASVSAPTGFNPYGNATRNKGRGPRYSQLDLGLHKAFGLWKEGTTLDFRGEAFNVLNQVNYGAPDGNRSNATYGLLTSAFPARRLQVAAKIIF